MRATSSRIPTKPTSFYWTPGRVLVRPAFLPVGKQRRWSDQARGLTKLGLFFRTPYVKKKKWFDQARGLTRPMV